MVCFMILQSLEDIFTRYTNSMTYMTHISNSELIVCAWISDHCPCSIEETCFQDFSEAFASELLENLLEMCPRYW